VRATVRSFGLLAPLALLALAGSARAEPDAGPTGLGELLARFASMPGFEARYVEEKRVALLARPLTSEGRLYFLPPSTLLRRVTAPGRQDIRITPGAITIDDTSGRQVIDLAARSQIRPLVESLLWLFSGDRDALEDAYRVGFVRTDPNTGDAAWQLTLEPRDERIAQLVERIVIAGRRYAAHEIRVDERGGDGSTLRVFEPDAERRFDAEERRALFGVDTPADDPADG